MFPEINLSGPFNAEPAWTIREAVEDEEPRNREGEWRQMMAL